MIILLIIGVVVLFLGILLFVYLTLSRKKLGSMIEKMLYSDSDTQYVETLFSTSIPLKGKPDAIIKTKEGIIPLEIKTGRTPTTPRDHHVMQLMAYCLLVHERYNKRPIGGILRYSETNTEFRILYTEEAEQSVKNIVREILDAKEHNISFTCKHAAHNS